MNYTFLRALKFAIQDFGRNFWLSLVTITVLVLAVLSVNILVTLRAVSDAVIYSIKNKVDISVFFKDDKTEAEINNFRQRIANLPEVASAEIISKDKALVEFKERHKNEPKILEAIAEVEKNPLVDSMIIKAKNFEDYKKILEVLKLDENQSLIKYQDDTDHQKIIDRINIVSSKAENVGIGLTIIFILISILIVFNTVRVMIYTHREEMGVMRLVGAASGFIRMPFFLEGILYSIFACAIGMGVIYGIFYAIGPYAASFLEVYDFDLATYYNNNFFWIFGSELAVIAFLNIFSSWIAMRRYLKV